MDTGVAGNEVDSLETKTRSFDYVAFIIRYFFFGICYINKKKKEKTRCFDKNESWLIADQIF